MKKDISDKKKLENAKDDFLMSAAHQLRSPLSSVRWNVESLLTPDVTLPASVKSKLRRIHDNTQVMIATVNELLDIARIIQGRLPVNPEKFDVWEMIRKQIRDVSEMARKQTVTISLHETHGRIPSIYIDPKHFAVVVHNILTNAIKYNRKSGNVILHISRLPASILITIEDTGIGVEKEDLPKLFTKFYRAANAKRVDAQGTGLGLFIVQSYIHSWGGTIKITSPSTDGIGTKVEFTVPLPGIRTSKT